jgi:hypothetical protein
LRRQAASRADAAAICLPVPRYAQNKAFTAPESAMILPTGKHSA